MNQFAKSKRLECLFAWRQFYQTNALYDKADAVQLEIEELVEEIQQENN